MDIAKFKGRHILTADINEEFSFTVCSSPHDCRTYTKKASELSKAEIQLLIAEKRKQKQQACLERKAARQEYKDKQAYYAAKAERQARTLKITIDEQYIYVEDPQQKSGQRLLSNTNLLSALQGALGDALDRPVLLQIRNSSFKQNPVYTDGIPGITEQDLFAPSPTKEL